jgi:hypothetical protein
VIALAKLHNYCINETDVDVPPLHAVDKLEIEMQGGVPLETTGWVILRLFQGNSSAAAIIFMTWTVFSVAGESATTSFKLNIHIISCPKIACMPSLLKPTCAVQLPFLVVDTHGPLLAVKTNT